MNENPTLCTSRKHTVDVVKLIIKVVVKGKRATSVYSSKQFGDPLAFKTVCDIMIVGIVEMKLTEYSVNISMEYY